VIIRRFTRKGVRGTCTHVDNNCAVVNQSVAIALAEVSDCWVFLVVVKDKCVATYSASDLIESISASYGVISRAANQYVCFGHERGWRGISQITRFLVVPLISSSPSPPLIDAPEVASFTLTQSSRTDDGRKGLNPIISLPLPPSQKNLPLRIESDVPSFPK